MRVLAIDYGNKITGIAVTDSLKLIATGLGTVETKILIDYLIFYIKNEPIETLVIGIPRMLNYKISILEQEIQKFIKKFKKKFIAIPIARVDERYTSKEAQKILIMSGLKIKNQYLIHKISATLILQAFLEKK